MLHPTGTPSETIHPWVAEGERKVRFGVHFMNPYDDWQKSCDAVLAAEALGFDSVWVADHPTLLADCWTVLAGWAAKTTAIRLGSLVSSVCYRHPVMLARLAVDVDRMSDGRLVLGLGIGDIPPEFHQLGVQYGPTRQRQELLEETVQVVKALWRTEPVTFEGNHLQVQAQLPVGPRQQPVIPLLIAGGGERTTLRQVAQYAHVSNFGAHPLAGNAARVADVKRKCQVLHKHCQNVGRDPHAILHSYVTMPFILGKTPETISRKLQALPAAVQQLFQPSLVTLHPQQAIAYFQALIQAGIQYFIVGVGLQDRETLELLQAEVIPALT